MAFTCSDIIKIIAAIIFPPLGVFLEVGCTTPLFLNIIFTILGMSLFQSISIQTFTNFFKQVSFQVFCTRCTSFSSIRLSTLAWLVNYWFLFCLWCFCCCFFICHFCFMMMSLIITIVILLYYNKVYCFIESFFHLALHIIIKMDFRNITKLHGWF